MSESLESLWSMYRPDAAAFIRAALLLGHSQEAIDLFLDEPSDHENEREDDDDQE